MVIKNHLDKNLPFHIKVNVDWNQKAIKCLGINVQASWGFITTDHRVIDCVIGRVVAE